MWMWQQIAMSLVCWSVDTLQCTVDTATGKLVRLGNESTDGKSEENEEELNF